MKNKNWKILDTISIFKDKWIDLRSETCKLPNGKIIYPWYILNYPNWVHIVAFDKNQNILVTKQYRNGIRKVVLELPCGGINKNEEPIEAAERELKEETGIIYSNIKNIGKFAANPSNHSNYVYVFLAEGDYTIQSTNQDDTEDIESEFISIIKINEYIKSGYFAQGLCISALYFALLYKNKIGS